jgi:CheY-like chemotaxis protein
MAYKLLLADDSVTIQRVIELTFADEDVQVVAVGDGKQAIERLQSDRPDIVLADVGMPGRDGYEVASFVKTNPEFAHIPVLLLTGAFEPIDEARAKLVGCDGVLVKPFEPQMVINRVKDLLAGRRPAGSWAASPAAQAPVRQSTAAGAEVAARGAPAALDSAPAAPAGSLEDYFDRLDAAFATLDGGASDSHLGERVLAPAAAQSRIAEPPVKDAGFSSLEVGDALADWDPDLTGGSGRPAPVESSPRPSAPTAVAAGPVAAVEPARPQAVQPASPPQPATAAPRHAVVEPAFPDGPIPALADAFAALLAAEQSQPIALSQPRPATVSDEVIEDIVQRVISRMGDHAVRTTVVDVAERLVREEIHRIKTQQ